MLALLLLDARVLLVSVFFFAALSVDLALCGLALSITMISNMRVC